MNVVKVSPKFQVVIPEEIRQSLQIKAGERIQVLEYDGRIELVPIKDIKEMRGFLKGIDTRIERDNDRL
jgi:AbrB family looped-hinge helix DNA binding protein